MRDNQKPNLRIIGDNSASGGHYNDAKIVGNGVINGDLECVNFKCIGDSRLSGNLKAGKVKIMGSISVEGSATVDDAHVAGDLNVAGDIHAGHFSLRGGITTKSGIKAENLSLMGYVTVKKNCEAETFKSDGRLNIDGLLNADEININTYGQSRVAEIGGDRIVVRRGSGIGKMLKYLFASSGFGGGTLRSNSIEGDDIRLSHTRANVVRGKNVIIESGCEIDLVEYKESLRLNHGSSVRERKQVA